ncbi:biotin carboxylase [Peribacillus deserti]|uniref:Biotin carboxylase n=1 Tax=Peribacillus deserti TaxID=673318 RepID=A0ABS2QNN3_9BACI|nr:ATP-grasp domain-containing protein [Peribacillus deserti]MBM7693881.1 biotin carboxylase [Peribacillus deserti]
MDTIVFVSANKTGSSRDALKAAKRLGFQTILLTDKPHFMDHHKDFSEVDQIILTNLRDFDVLRGKIMELQRSGSVIKAIMSFIDPFVHTSAALAEEFCQTGVPSKPIRYMEDKVLTRSLLSHLSVSPYYQIYNPENPMEPFVNLQEEQFPLIVKSPSSAGSRDVLLANNRSQLYLSLKELLAKYENKPILVEKFLSGPQYLIEVVVYNGNINVVAIIEQEVTFFKRFIITGYCLLPEVDKPFYDDLYKSIQAIVQAFQMENGACHLEMRLVDNEWKLIEANPRIAGSAMNRIIEIGCGIKLVEETIQLFLGNKPNLTKKHSKFVYAHYFTVETEGKLLSVSGDMEASKSPGVEEVFIKSRVGKAVRPPIRMGDRYGYVIASSKNKEDAKRIALEAAQKVHFEISTKIKEN